MIRKLDIVKVVFYLLRPAYSLWNKIGVSSVFNVVFRFLLGCLSPLNRKIASYEQKCDKNYALASNDGSNISIQAYLNKYYGTGAGFPNPIIIVNAPVFNTYLYPYSEIDPQPLMLYPYGETPFMVYNYGSTANSPIIKIPTQLTVNTALYEDFIADANSLISYSLQYAIEPY